MDKNRPETWYEEAKNQTLETLPDFMKHLLCDEPHNYESICDAIAACAVAAAWAGDKSPQGGITGWQGGWVMWKFIQNWMGKQDSCGLRLVDYDEMLYPQYDYKFTEKVLTPDIWESMQKKAKQLIDENKGSCSPIVMEHWKSIANGVVPFGYTVKY